MQSALALFCVRNFQQFLGGVLRQRERLARRWPWPFVLFYGSAARAIFWHRSKPERAERPLRRRLLLGRTRNNRRQLGLGLRAWPRQSFTQNIDLRCYVLLALYILLFRLLTLKVLHLLQFLVIFCLCLVILSLFVHCPNGVLLKVDLGRRGWCKSVLRLVV